jgi:hypothetical protein
MAITRHLCTRLAFKSTSSQDGTDAAAVNQTAAQAASPIQTPLVLFNRLEIAAGTIGKAKS